LPVASAAPPHFWANEYDPTEWRCWSFLHAILTPVSSTDPLRIPKAVHFGCQPPRLPDAKIGPDRCPLYSHRKSSHAGSVFLIGITRPILVLASLGVTPCALLPRSSKPKSDPTCKDVSHRAASVVKMRSHGSKPHHQPPSVDVRLLPGGGSPVSLPDC